MTDGSRARTARTARDLWRLLPKHSFAYSLNGIAIGELIASTFFAIWGDGAQAFADAFVGAVLWLTTALWLVHRGLRERKRNGCYRGAASDHPDSEAGDTGSAAGGVTAAGGSANGAAGARLNFYSLGGYPSLLPTLTASRGGIGFQQAIATIGAVAAGSGMSMPSTPKDLPTVEQEEPIAAWKQAALVRQGNTVVLRPMVMTDSTIEADAEAECRPSDIPFKSHPAPAVGCACGFYAYKERPAPGGNEFPSMNTWGGHTVVLEVELSGTVIECETGYRAGYQRVLAVHVPRRCSQFGCVDPASAVVSRADGDPGRPVCATHAARDGWDAVTLADIGNRLGIECVWDET